MVREKSDESGNAKDAEEDEDVREMLTGPGSVESWCDWSCWKRCKGHVLWMREKKVKSWSQPTRRTAGNARGGRAFNGADGSRRSAPGTQRSGAEKPVMPAIGTKIAVLL